MNVELRRGGSFWLLGLVLAAVMAVPVQTAAAEDPAAAMYDPAAVWTIELTLPKASEETLEAEPTKDYVEGFMTLRETGGTPGTEGPPVINAMKVGIRLKGNVGGSFRPLDTGKAAFKIKCNFESGKKCLGLKKITLNNMVQDASMVHETLAYGAFAANGVPASRSGYAYVRVNGEDFGLYLNVETLDDVALKRLFGSFDDEVQHLYEVGEANDVFPGGAAEFEVDEGDEVDRGDLEALAVAANGGGKPWATAVAPYADLAEMTKMWAVEKYIDHWDGYSGHAEEGTRPNNYFLFSEPSGRFKMLPWGTDQTWAPTKGFPKIEVTFDGHGGLLFDKCLEDAECGLSYWYALQEFATAGIAALNPGALTTSTAALLAPWEQEEREHGRPEFDAGEVEEGIEETLEEIANRPGEASEWLATHAPPGAAAPVAIVETPPAGPAAHIGRAHVAGGILTTKLQLLVSATVTMRAKIVTHKGSISVCSDQLRAEKAGPVTLRCHISAAIRKRLRERWLKFTIITRVDPTAGPTETITRHLTVPRTGS